MTTPSFDDLVVGWATTGCFYALTDMIERSAAWVKDHGGIEALTDSQRAIVAAMIERQMLLADDLTHVDEPDTWCETCQNTGEIDCHCGGDNCFCSNNGSEPCPDCHG